MAIYTNRCACRYCYLMGPRKQMRSLAGLRWIRARLIYWGVTSSQKIAYNRITPGKPPE